MEATAVIDIMFKLRSEAYSIWALVFGINTAVIGWILGKNILFNRRQRVAAIIAYLFFVLLIGLAFKKTYDELNLASRDLDFALTRTSVQGAAKDGLLTYLRNKDYGPNLLYAFGLNGVFFILVTAIIWNQSSSRKNNSEARYEK
jgi:hypothetical protein